MTGSMIERIARALYRQGDTGPYGPDDEDAEWHQFADDARAVLNAMREPTDHMASEGGAQVSEYSSSEYTARNAWRVMIDAALEEG